MVFQYSIDVLHLRWFRLARYLIAGDKEAAVVLPQAVSVAAQPVVSVLHDPANTTGSLPVAISVFISIVGSDHQATSS
jgi:hypothetical protein